MKEYLYELDFQIDGETVKMVEANYVPRVGESVSILDRTCESKGEYILEPTVVKEVHIGYAHFGPQGIDDRGVDCKELFIIEVGTIIN